ncbi:peptidase M16 [Acrocarpospora pleiomorpha]|uniref:Peptidase M16 n=2 Tax=Acrocarpospora pleiomorpha TaxID=90975 RepID=A0A5M3XVW5_9ACTN|nr:peptidase M16 [Acrocarpospora pleiomorpha]
MIADRMLPNGLRVLALRHGITPLAEVRLHLPAPCPTRRDLAESTVLAASLAQVQDAYDGVELSATADIHRVTVSASSSVADLESLLAALAQVVEGAPTELAAARGQLIAQFRMVRAHPDIAVRIELAQHMFGDHPATFLLPAEAELAGVTRVRRAFDPRGAVLVLLTSQDPEQMADAAEKALGGWRPLTPSPPPPLPPLPAIEGGRLALLPRPGAPQSRIRLRAQALTPNDARYPALFLACNVLGGYVSSRLSRNLRENKGYVYGITSMFDLHPGSAFLAIEADTAAATTNPALAAVADELRGMRTHPPTAEEIQAARAFAMGSTTTRLAPRAAFATALADLAGKAVDPLFLLGFARELAAVTPEEVVAAAEEFLDPGRFSGVVAADPELAGFPAESVKAGNLTWRA